MIDCFVQAEGGIRNSGVTGVQTCPLPSFARLAQRAQIAPAEALTAALAFRPAVLTHAPFFDEEIQGIAEGAGLTIEEARSEERRVGKECRSRWSPYH